VLAWKQYQATEPKQTACDTGVVHAGLADLPVDEQNGVAVEAAIYLFALTADPAYEAYIAKHYKEAHPYHDIGWSRYKPDQGEALLFYAALPGSDRTLSRSILADKEADVKAGNRIYGFNPDDDLYRAFMHEAQYHWEATTRVPITATRTSMPPDTMRGSPILRACGPSCWNPALHARRQSTRYRVSEQHVPLRSHRLGQ